MTTGSACCIGVDVGTASARAGAFDLSGSLLGSARHPITIHRDGAGVEQSSAEIWEAVCASVRGALAEASVSPEHVAGIGFMPVLSVTSTEPVLLGSAILGTVSAGRFGDIPTAMRAMSMADVTFEPGPTHDLHDRRYAAFQLLQRAARDTVCRTA